jgi:two-component system response regulator AdeR
MVAWPVEPLSPEPSVLITDDNDAWRKVVEDILAREGFLTRQATCGEEAIEVVRTQWIDIVLIDFHMPRLDGIQTLRIIRRSGYQRAAVIMTAHPEEVPATEVRELRVTTVLPKPTDRQRIVTTVTTVIRRTLEPEE